MAGITVNVTGNDAIIANLGSLNGAVKAGVQKAIENALQATYDGSQNDVPVLSGALKASGAITVGDLQGSVSYGDDTVDYAVFVEEGTSRMSAQPYLFPNFVSAVGQMQSDLQGIV